MALVKTGRGTFRGFETQNSQSTSVPSSPTSEGMPLDTRISNNLQRIAHHILQLKKMITSIGTSMDSRELRKNIRSVQDELTLLTKETNDDIKTYANTDTSTATDREKKELKLQSERFRSMFSVSLKDYKELQTTIKVKMRDSLRLSLMKSGFHDIDVSENGDLVKDGQQLQLEVIEKDNDLETIKEREKELKQLEQDIRDITSMFKDLGTLVAEQAEPLNIAEKNIEDAADNVEQAEIDLRQANDNVDSSRKKTFVLVVIAVIVLAVTVTIICLVTLT